MEKNENKNKENNKCINSISFTMISILFFIFESISLIMSILCLVMIEWNFLKPLIKVLNIVSLVVISLIILINFLIFYKIKNVRYNIIKNYGKRMCLTFFLLFIYFIVVIFHIYNSIYLSKQLKIVDDPEYRGRDRDKNDRDNNPQKYEDIPLKEFIIAAVCPSIISLLNILCIIFCVVFRKKMIMTYNQMLSSYDENKNNEVIMQKRKNKHKNYNKRSKKRRNSTEIRRKPNEINENINIEPKRTNSRRTSVTMRVNSLNNGSQFIQRESNKNLTKTPIRKIETLGTFDIVENIETFNSETRELKPNKPRKSKFYYTNTPQKTKLKMIDKENNNENNEILNKVNNKEKNKDNVKDSKNKKNEDDKQENDMKNSKDSDKENEKEDYKKNDKENEKEDDKENDKKNYEEIDIGYNNENSSENDKDN